MLHQIIYTSAAAPSANLDDFKSIARHSSQNNKTLNVTGIMLFTDGVIFQVLEGEKEIVETLYDRIKRDDRHSSIMKMIARDTPEREFADWSMGFSEMSADHANEIAFMLNKNTLKSAMPASPSAELKVLSNTFARVNGL